MKKLFVLISAVLLIAAGCGKQAKEAPTPALPAITEPPREFVAASVQTPPQKSKDTEIPASKSRLPALPTNCGGNFDCYETYYRSLVKDYSVADAFVQLKTQYQTNGYVQSQCHPLTHVIGQAALELYPNVSEAYTKGDSYCWSGFYHGVMEGVVAKVGRENFPSGLNTYCSDIPGKASYSFDYFNCVHGLGHSVMVYTSNELFESLDMCEGLNGSWEKTSCYGGAFMENVIVDNKNHYTKYLKKDDLLYPCNAVDAIYKHQCYIMQTSYILKENGGNFKATFELCEKSDEGYEIICNQSLGRDASSRSAYKPEGIKNICTLGENFSQQSNCVIGAVKDVISYFHSDKQAAEFCNMLDADLKEICESTAETYYKNF